MSPKISVIIPVYNQAFLLQKTLESLKHQSFEDFEIIVVDDCSKDNSSEIAKQYTSKVFKNTVNRGPAYSRNLGIKVSEGDIIAFIDSDCEADKHWLYRINEVFNDRNNDRNIGAVMGNTIVPESTYVGDSISALGFPGGGSIGFDRVWKVSNDGLTEHISSCNAAIRKEIFDIHGSFDESFPFAGGEDSEFSHRLTKNGVKIKYSPHVIVHHIPRTSIFSFIKWQIKRGQTNYHFKKKVGNVGSFIKLRLWSTRNILKKHLLDIKLPMILFLLSLSFIFQQYGYFKEKMKRL